MENLFKLPKGIRKKIVLIGLAIFFIYFGIDHFVNPDFYLSIMPPSFPLHEEAVYISGFFEIIGGIGVLVHRFRKIFHFYTEVQRLEIAYLFGLGHVI